VVSVIHLQTTRIIYRLKGKKRRRRSLNRSHFISKYVRFYVIFTNRTR